MSLKAFTYPFPETRFLHAGPNVYKFKIRYGSSIRGEEIENKEVISQELEDSIRVVLGNVDNLQPFATEHFVVFPYKSRWERVSHLKFKHGDIVLAPYPFVFTLYVEMKWFHENLSPEFPVVGNPISSSPLGLVLDDRKAAGALKRKRKCMEVPGSPSIPRQDSVKTGTSSQGPGNKKPLTETGRNRERETQQERQATPARDGAGGQGQGSKAGGALAGQSSPPPPKASAEPGTSGFFAFLSSLFPFRGFFRRSNSWASQKPQRSGAGAPPCSGHSGLGERGPPGP